MMSKTYVLAFVSMVAGVILWGGFNTFMEKTNGLTFCISCHEMEATVYQEYKLSKHYHNPSGVRAICSDCHVPRDWTHKFMRKIQASSELYHWAMGSIDSQEKFEAKRHTLAKREWQRMRENNSRECRNCHSYEAMAFHDQSLKGSRAMQDAFKKGKACIDCHKGIAHKMPDINRANREMFVSLVEASNATEARMGQSSVALFDKKLFLSPKKEALGVLSVGAQVKNIGLQENLIQVQFRSWRRKALPSKLYIAPEQRQTVGVMDVNDTEVIKVLRTIEPADSTYIWEEVEVNAWMEKEGLSHQPDRVREYAKSLYEDNCSLCHSAYAADTYGVNDWIGHFNSMKRLTPMQEQEAGLVLYYLQSHAKKDAHE